MFRLGQWHGSHPSASTKKPWNNENSAATRKKFDEITKINLHSKHEPFAASKGIWNPCSNNCFKILNISDIQSSYAIIHQY